jgi:hypothetical protein
VDRGRVEHGKLKDAVGRGGSRSRAERLGGGDQRGRGEVAEAEDAVNGCDRLGELAGLHPGFEAGASTGAQLAVHAIGNGSNEGLELGVSAPLVERPRGDADAAGDFPDPLAFGEVVRGQKALRLKVFKGLAGSGFRKFPVAFRGF